MGRSTTPTSWPATCVTCVARTAPGRRVAGAAGARGLVDGDRRRPAWTLVDVGTGGADIPIALMAHARSGPNLTVTAIDDRPEVLEARARPPGDRSRRRARARGRGRPTSSTRTARSTSPTASMVVHHLSRRTPPALPARDEPGRAHGMVVNDLTSRTAGAWGVAVQPLTTRNRLTRNDAPLSVRRAYSRAELIDLVRRGGPRAVADVGGFGHRARSRRSGDDGIGRRRRRRGRRTGRGVDRGALGARGDVRVGGAVARVPLAGVRRVRLTGRGRGAATARRQGGDAGARRPADPGDARRDGPGRGSG